VELALRDIFDAPTVGGIAARIEVAAIARAPLNPRPRPERLPLSFAQQQLWYVHQMDPNNPLHQVSVTLRISGRLDMRACRDALNDVIERHEILRTVFYVDDIPYQHVIPAEDVDPDIHVSVCAEADLPSRFAEMTTQAFDLGRAPALRICLLEVLPRDRTKYVLMVAAHRIAVDGVSLPVLLRDLAAAYAERSGGHAPQWAPLPVQYGDYTLWQRELLGDVRDENSMLARQVDYWTNALRDLPAEIPLPTDWPRPPVPSYRGGSVEFFLDSDLYRRLLELAQRTSSTLFTVLQAGVAALLTKLGAGTDIPLSTPVAGRNEYGMADMVGLFVNTLVLRTDASRNPSFEDLIFRAREAALAAFAHQDVPFEYLVEVLRPELSSARRPLTQVMVELVQAPTALQLPGLSVVGEQQPTLAKFDLVFFFVERVSAATGIAGRLDYATDVFAEQTARIIAEHLIRLLRAVTTDPARPMSTVDTARDAEPDLP
jgi:hypothetical protein